jgi:hypothetical protein
MLSLEMIGMRLFEFKYLDDSICSKNKLDKGTHQITNGGCCRRAIEHGME